MYVPFERIGHANESRAETRECRYLSQQRVLLRATRFCDEGRTRNAPTEPIEESHVPRESLPPWIIEESNVPREALSFEQCCVGDIVESTPDPQTLCFHC